MGPRTKFTKTQIIEAALEIAQIEGLDNLTMRKIAKKMGSSVAPIYVNFKNMDDLREALVDRIIGIGQQLLYEESTGNPFHDMGRASLRFALEYSVLFRDLVMKKNSYMQSYDEKMTPVLIGEMSNDPELEGFTAEELKTILLKMKIFQLGISVMAANGLLPRSYKKHDLLEMLSSAAQDVIVSARLNKEQRRVV